MNKFLPIALGAESLRTSHVMPHSYHSHKRYAPGILLETRKDSGHAGMTKWRLSVTVLMIISVIAFVPGIASAAVISDELNTVMNTSDQDIPVILTLSEKVDLRQFSDKDKGLKRYKVITALKEKARTTQAPLVSFLNGKGAKYVVSFWIFNGISASLSATEINELAGQPGIESIRLDATLSGPQPAATTGAQPEWNLHAIKAPELWNLGYRGQGIVVAGMDTGVDAGHPDLNASWRGGNNSWFDPNGQHLTPYDRSGHGTQTMSVIVGGSAGGTAIGVAPDAEWIAVKIFDDSGYATLSGIHSGFQWLLDPDDNPAVDDAPDIVNNSWNSRDGINECSIEFADDIQALRASEIAVVFSAGNEGPSPYTSISPANVPGSLSAGAVDSWLSVAAFSSRGPSACSGAIYPDLVAPGVNIRTADLTSNSAFPLSFVSVSGTSFASPHVAGLMALLMSAFPGAGIQTLESEIRGNAADLGVSGPDNSYGYGLIDAAAAYRSLAGTPPVAVNDNATTSKNTPVTINVTANDYDPDGSIDAATVAIKAVPRKGVAVNNLDGTINFTPRKKAKGKDSFTYTVKDNDGKFSNEAKVTVNVK